MHDLKQMKIVNSTNVHYDGITLPMITDDIENGLSMDILGMNFTVTQWGGGILILSNEKNVLTLQDVTPEPEPEPVIEPTLTINKEIDIFFGSKEIRLNFDMDNSSLTKGHGVTYNEVYEFLKKEWEVIAKAYPEYSSFPMEHAEGTNNYCFLNAWNWFDSDYTLYLKDGCWSGKDMYGRHI